MIRIFAMGFIKTLTIFSSKKRLKFASEIFFRNFQATQIKVYHLKRE
ncbi:MAG: hypothetical protein AAFR77_03770 [Cyanobacteria bacterium J06631_2]